MSSIYYGEFFGRGRFSLPIAKMLAKGPASVGQLQVRALDVVGASLLLLLFAPLMLVTAWLVTALDGGPALYCHARIGRDGRTFYCLKFRSMTIDADRRLPALLADEEALCEWQERRKLRTDQRVTRLGHWLRVTSIDELPQLLNVLAGDMSLVGPRPIVADEIKAYGRRFYEYAAIRPGLTGLWQVSGRNAVTYRRRVAMDVWLCRNLNVQTYFRLLGRTVTAVLSRNGAM